ncbi:protein tyrosine kinase [Plectosphaerella plurivora]|uniref:Protein tyrosine kinase n=1 Tax=Plectosphaerella plurivora TaxID=936078 RepID=A0A9P9AAQ2_9PEZI|nr:protein tyrosine kinase [Plectosphaerella plurivora]
MSQFRLTIEDGQFRDRQGRTVVLRGINVAADAKLPSEPNQPSHIKENFFDGDNVKFHARPFPVSDAHTHFSRLRRWGYNTIRYVFTWEAIEAAGPGRYDEDFISHTIEILRIAKGYGFYVIMDPHQDVWSRFCGGSGAPMWTIYACGLDPKKFAVTEAALVHNVWDPPETFPKMIWASNYWRLAAGTICTLFFAGRDLAPKCIINGINIQDFLQGHFYGAVAHLARRIHEAGDLENDVIIGWESMNEPNRGLAGYEDLTTYPAEQQLKKGTAPTMWQAILTGSGRACEIDTYEMGNLGSYKSGSRLVDPKGEVAWLSRDYDDSRYGWNRDEGWKLGHCIWAQHGVWDPATDTLLQKNYFKHNPRTGMEYTYPAWTNTHFMDFFRGYRDAVRSIHKDCIVVMQLPTLELPPEIKGTPDDEPKLAFSPHWYDGITLMTKKWNKLWNVDVVGVLRGKYWTPAFAVKVGEQAIRNCFKDQHNTLNREGKERMGNHPCILSEFGIPYDMDEKHAYKTGDYTSQSAAMDANYYGVEGSGMEGHCLWVYVATNDHEHGDQWNGEDLSIYSKDDKLLPVSPLPPGVEDDDIGEIKRIQSSRNIPDDQAVTPDNLNRTLTNPSITSDPAQNKKDPDLSNAPGFRAAEAYVRPTGVNIAGKVTEAGFDLRNCEYNLKIVASAPPPDNAPTIVFLPEYHFPSENCTVAVSSGKWELSVDEDPDEPSSPALQRLKWWHGDGVQTLKVNGEVRRHNVPEATEEEAGYLEQCRQQYGACSLM